MTTQTDREIIARFQNLFNTDEDFTTTAMDRGFENVGPGWLSIMTQLCERLVPLAQGDFRIVAVKSKYATLRMNYRGGDGATEAEIERTKSQALVTCERCGRPGEQRTGEGWMAVRCAACAG